MAHAHPRLSRLLFLLAGAAVSGCSGSPPTIEPTIQPTIQPADAPATPAQPVAGEAWIPSDAEKTLLQRLSRHEPDECDAIEAGVDAAPQALLSIIAHVPDGAPPVLAARCLVRRHMDIAEVEREVLRWLRAPGSKGLAFVVVDNLDALSADLAVRLARTALDGPYAAPVRARLKRSGVTEVRDLVAGAGAGVAP